MFGLRQMLMSISRIFGRSDVITPRTSKSLHLINPLMPPWFSTIRRISLRTCRVDDSDWGRDTQIIVDLALSPDRTFGNKSRLAKQARDGTGATIIFSAYPLLFP